MIWDFWQNSSVKSLSKTLKNVILYRWKQAQRVYAISWPCTFGLHVCYPSTFRHGTYADHPECRWLSSDDPCNSRLQNKVVGLCSGSLAYHSQLLFQCILDHRLQETYERFSKIRLLPGSHTLFDPKKFIYIKLWLDPFFFS